MRVMDRANRRPAPWLHIASRSVTMRAVNVQLRPAEEADDGFLFALHRSALGPVIEATWGPWDDQTQRAFHAAWFGDRSRLSIVLVDGEPVGVIDVQEQPGGLLYLARLELLPATQGRGVGSALMHQLIERAQFSGLRAVELDVLERNERARRLYERLGFQVVAARPPSCACVG